MTVLDRINPTSSTPHLHFLWSRPSPHGVLSPNSYLATIIMCRGSFRLPASIITSRLLAFPNTRRVSLPISLLYFWPGAVRTMASTSHSPPRRFPSSGFVALDPKLKVEEEELPSYVPEDFYPVTIGEVFVERYQLVTKLGFGMSSTVWLCRDLVLVFPKICAHAVASR